jgi:hypothetical protein
VPGTRLADYAALAKLMKRADVPISSVIATHGPLWERLLDPVLLAVLNTPPGEGSLRLTANVLRETIARGGKALHPCVAVPSLAEAFINPALGWLASHGARAELGRRLRALTFEGDRVASLDWGQARSPWPRRSGDARRPAWVAQGSGAGPFRARHVPRHRQRPFYDCAARRGAADARPAQRDGGMAVRLPDRVSVTISAADHLVDSPREEIAQACWNDICRAFGIAAPLPAWQVVKEKRATFSATPEQDASARPRAPPGATCSSPATGPPPAFPPPSRGLAQRAKPPPRWSWPAKAPLSRPLLKTPAEGTCKCLKCPCPHPRRGRSRARACERRCARQQADGHWVFELEADARFQPNTSSCATSWANRKTSNSKPRSGAICAASSRPSTMAGRSTMMAASM